MVRVEGPRLAWWDVNANASRTTTLPALTLQVAPGVGSFAAAPAATGASAGATDDGRITVPGVQGRILPWALATVVFALLWFATLLWGLHRRPQPQVATDTTPAAPATSKAAQANLKRALAAGELGEVVEHLCAMATPVARDLDELQQRLVDPRQRAALALLQRARWAGGDVTAARAALRAAFKPGPRWQQPATVHAGPLPPLYPLA
jgi:hypothetical protein